MGKSYTVNYSCTGSGKPVPWVKTCKGPQPEDHTAMKRDCMSYDVQAGPFGCWCDNCGARRKNAVSRF